jgi:hypothetical protein
MMRMNVLRQLQRLALLGAAMLVFGQFWQFARMPARMPEVMAVSLAAPYSFGGRVVDVLRQAAAWRMDPAQQLWLYGRYLGGHGEAVNQVRVWQGIAAVVAVLWIARVGRLLCGAWAGVLAAFLLACLAPAAWNMMALRVACVVIHMELFLRASSSDDPLWWVLWTAASWVLYCTGVFAEPLPLQTWFIGLAVCWWWWRGATRWCAPRAADEAALARRRPRHHETLWQRLQRDAGFLRYVGMLVVMCAVMTLLTVVGVLFFSHLSVSVRSLGTIVGISGMLSLGTAVLLLLLPLFSRERTIVMDAIVDLGTSDRQTLPETLLLEIRPRGFAHMMLAYAVSMVLFLPVLYQFHTHMDVFITANDTRAYLTYLRDGTWDVLAGSIMPLLFLVLVVVRLLLQQASRARLIGAVMVVICSSLYIHQARYAAFSTPFHIIAAAGVVTELCALVVATLRGRIAALLPFHAREEQA